MSTIKIDNLNVEVELAERLLGNMTARRPTLLVAPPGSGKTMLVRRLAFLGTFRAPHHTCSKIALVGQNHGKLAQYADRCEFALAHRGILFLDETVEFSRSALDAVRSAYRNGDVKVFEPARQEKVAAEPWIVGTVNPCGCGWRGTNRVCQCRPESDARYQARIAEIIEAFGFDVIKIASTWRQNPMIGERTVGTSLSRAGFEATIIMEPQAA